MKKNNFDKCIRETSEPKTNNNFNLKTFNFNTKQAEKVKKLTKIKGKHLNQKQMMISF